jgi:TolB protein
VRLTSNSALDASPDWSVDGTRLLFVSERDGNPELYVMDVNCPQLAPGCGSIQIRLTNQAGADAWPSWQVRQ